MNAVLISFLITKRNYQMILTKDGLTVFAQMAHGKATCSNSTGLFYLVCRQYYPNHSNWKTI